MPRIRFMQVASVAILIAASVQTLGMGSAAAAPAPNAIGRPGPPRNVDAVAANAEATVTFSPPARRGLAPITRYTVTARDLTNPARGGQTAAGRTSPLTVRTLHNGDLYTFTVTARNVFGTSRPSLPSFPVIPGTVPAPPIGAEATAGNTDALVKFKIPVSNGGVKIRDYTVTATDHTDPSRGGQTATRVTSPITVRGLTNGDSYTFTVVARNFFGKSKPSAPTNAVIPGTVPDPPTGVTATAGNQSAAVAFTPPLNDGGPPITGYTVLAVDATEPGRGGQTATGPGSPLTVTGLHNGDDYTFTVQAMNAFGDSVPSAVSNTVTPGTVPHPPTLVHATGGNASAAVTFTAPVNTGGAPITSYTVTASPGGKAASGLASPITVPGLTNGTAYTFTVTAKNIHGMSLPSDPSNSVTPATVPGAPTQVTAFAGHMEATVSFTPPVDDGGAAITHYTVTAEAISPCVSRTCRVVGRAPLDGQMTTGPGSPIVVHGLTNGTTYTFTVTATNRVGTSDPSEQSNAVTPMGPVTVADPPTDAHATAGNGTAAVTFTPPVNDGGAVITSYTVRATDHTNPGHGGQTADGSGSPITVTGLTNGDQYSFQVTATNSVGPSAPSKASNTVTPLGPAVTITGPAFAQLNTSVELSGTAAPNAIVNVWFHKYIIDDYTNRRRLHANGSGHWATSYVANNDYRYYATSGGRMSPHGLTQIKPFTVGPATVPLGSTVNIVGTARPGMTIRVWFKKKDVPGYTARRTLTATAGGRWMTSYVANTDYRYYATNTTNAGMSNTVLTQVR